MIFYMLAAVIWVTLQRGDGTLVECSTAEPIEYFPGAKIVVIDQCSDEIFNDGFEEIAE